MPAKDFYRDNLKRALIKDGWNVTDDPLTFKWGKKDIYIDLGAEEIIAAEKRGRQIAVEIKSFISDSEVEDLKNTLGAVHSLPRHYATAGTGSNFVSGGP
jgi:hypothetical protein